MATVTHAGSEIAARVESRLIDQLYGARMVGGNDLGLILLDKAESKLVIDAFNQRDDLEIIVRKHEVKMKGLDSDRLKWKALAITFLVLFILYALADALALVGAS
jgi:hypothetical protein